MTWSAAEGSRRRCGMPLSVVGGCVVSSSSRDSDCLTVEHSLHVGPDSGNLDPHLVVGGFGDTLPGCPCSSWLTGCARSIGATRRMLRQDTCGFVGDLGAGVVAGRRRPGRGQRSRRQLSPPLQDLERKRESRSWDAPDVGDRSRAHVVPATAPHVREQHGAGPSDAVEGVGRPATSPVPEKSRFRGRSLEG